MNISIRDEDKGNYIDTKTSTAIIEIEDNSPGGRSITILEEPDGTIKVDIRSTVGEFTTFSLSENEALKNVTGEEFVSQIILDRIQSKAKEYEDYYEACTHNSSPNYPMNPQGDQ